MKKIFVCFTAFMLCTVLALSLISCKKSENPPSEIEDPSSGQGEEVGASEVSVGLKFKSFKGGTCAVSGIGSCTDEEIVIPDKSPDGDTVISIGQRAFYDCDNVVSVVLPDTVKTIGYESFSDCDGLESVAIPDGVATIEDYAFSGCTSLKSVSIPGSVQVLKNGVFRDCTLLEQVNIGEGVKTISDYTFGKCIRLSYVSIPSSVTYIGEAFTECSALKFKTYDNAYYLGNDQNPYHALIRVNGENVVECFIHKQTEVIASNAFAFCGRITDVYFTRSESEWDAFPIAEGNEILFSASIHCNSVSIEDMSCHVLNYQHVEAYSTLPLSTVGVSLYDGYDVRCDGMSTTPGFFECEKCGRTVEVNVTVEHGEVTEWALTREATCTVKGEEAVCCVGCNKPVGTDKKDIPELGHNGTYNDFNPKTNREVGNCKRCGSTVERAVKDLKIETVPANCMSGAYSIYTFTNEDGAKRTIKKADPNSSPNKNHTLSGQYFTWNDVVESNVPGVKLFAGEWLNECGDIADGYFMCEKCYEAIGIHIIKSHVYYNGYCIYCDEKER